MSDDFRKGIDGYSRHLGINLAAQHFTAAEPDRSASLHSEHDRVLSLHMEHRRMEDGPEAPFGVGETPLREILCSVRDNGWKIPVPVAHACSHEDRVEVASGSLG